MEKKAEREAHDGDHWGSENKLVRTTDGRAGGRRFQCNTREQPASKKGLSILCHIS